uniref:Uncharacterized protein n=1 Tax=Arundo donax TaxID=35708 RepID=A0A0A9FSL4_ARUDO
MHKVTNSFCCNTNIGIRQAAGTEPISKLLPQGFYPGPSRTSTK